MLDGGREEGEEPEPRVPPLPVGRQQQLGAHGAEIPQRARLHRRRKPGGNDGFIFLKRQMKTLSAHEDDYWGSCHCRRQKRKLSAPQRKTNAEFVSKGYSVDALESVQVAPSKPVCTRIFLYLIAKMPSATVCFLSLQGMGYKEGKILVLVFASGKINTESCTRLV